MHVLPGYKKFMSLEFQSVSLQQSCLCSNRIISHYILPLQSPEQIRNIRTCPPSPNPVTGALRSAQSIGTIPGSVAPGSLAPLIPHLRLWPTWGHDFLRGKLLILASGCLHRNTFNEWSAASKLTTVNSGLEILRQCRTIIQLKPVRTKKENNVNADQFCFHWIRKYYNISYNDGNA